MKSISFFRSWLHRCICVQVIIHVKHNAQIEEESQALLYLPSLTVPLDCTWRLDHPIT